MKRLPEPPPDSRDYGKVLAVLANGDVTLELGDGTVEALPCLDSYWPREVGQTVAIQSDSAIDRWVLGPVGTPNREMPVIPEIPEIPEIPYIPPEIKVSWGDSTPPGTGWITTDSGVYVRDDGSGKRSMFFPLPSPEPEPSEPPPPDPVEEDRDPVWVSPSWTAAWRNGQLDNWNDGKPAQARWYTSSNGNWSGGWGFPDLASIVGTSTVTKMQIEITREDSAHGVNSSDTANLWLSTAGSKPSDTPFRSTQWKGVKLYRGQKGLFTLPSLWRDALANGNRKSIVCYDTAGHYMIFEKDLRLKVFF